MSRNQKHFSNGSGDSSSPEVDALGNLPQGEPLFGETVENRPPTPFFPTPTDQPAHQAIQIDPRVDQAIHIDPPAELLPELPYAMPLPSARRTQQSPVQEVPELPHEIPAPSTSSLARRTQQSPVEEVPELPHAIPRPSTSSLARRTQQSPVEEVPELPHAILGLSTSSLASRTDEFPQAIPGPSTSSLTRRAHRATAEERPHETQVNPMMGAQSPGSGTSPSFAGNPPTPLSPFVHVLYSFPRGSPTSSTFSFENEASKYLIRIIRDHRRTYQVTNERSIVAGLYEAASCVIPSLPPYDVTYDFIGSEGEDVIATREERRIAFEKRMAEERNRRDCLRVVKCIGVMLIGLTALFGCFLWIDEAIRTSDSSNSTKFSDPKA